MSLFEYLELQPIELNENENPDDLNTYKEDEIIDLSGEDDGEDLIDKWERAEKELHRSRRS